MDKARANQVLDRTDEILRWEQSVDSRRTRSSPSTSARSATSATGDKENGWPVPTHRYMLRYAQRVSRAPRLCVTEVPPPRPLDR